MTSKPWREASLPVSNEEDDLWHALLGTGQNVATEADFDRGHRADARGTDSARYVTFELAGETYGLPIVVIEQILRPFKTTRVPRSADFLVGIGNIKGTVMPVIDLSRRLALNERSQIGRATRTIVVRFEGDLHGLIVDRVLGVTPIPTDGMEEAPGGIGRTRAEFIESLGRYDDQLIIFLSLSTLLDPRAFVRLDGALSEFHAA